MSLSHLSDQELSKVESYVSSISLAALSGSRSRSLLTNTDSQRVRLFPHPTGNFLRAELCLLLLEPQKVRGCRGQYRGGEDVWLEVI